MPYRIISHAMLSACFELTAQLSRINASTSSFPENVYSTVLPSTLQGLNAMSRATCSHIAAYSSAANVLQRVSIVKRWSGPSFALTNAPTEFGRSPSNRVRAKRPKLLRRSHSAISLFILCCYVEAVPRFSSCCYAGVLAPQSTSVLLYRGSSCRKQLSSPVPKTHPHTLARPLYALEGGAERASLSSTRPPRSRPPPPRSIATSVHLTRRKSTSQRNLTQRTAAFAALQHSTYVAICLTSPSSSKLAFRASASQPTSRPQPA
eukprot:CAMPEP_0185835860 /NCGR_PEP_ID=MMETSP1353-20130828/8622_1 /TAXON_ID=1077150 /ORGANISM="Erythrolobus australicus, Strain CCMP3124" /LENGTH=262 /DNA_ID=CAMNT_0028534565 /DNA_START=168 /DNA_END=953 /DNA_ORIENTATION=-